EGTDPQYVATGHIVYATSDGSVSAVPFDTIALTITGAPLPLVSDAHVKRTGAVELAVARNGTLTYVTGSESINQYVLITRDGATTPLVGPPGHYAFPRLSPAGERLALSVTNGSRADRRNELRSDIWLV